VADSPILAQLVEAVADGTIINLTRDGCRLAAVVPIDLVEALLAEPASAEAVIALGGH